MSRRRKKPDWLIDAEWKRYVYCCVGPRIWRTRQLLAHPDRLSPETLIDLQEQAMRDRALLLSTMKPESVDKMFASDRWAKLEQVRKDTAALADKLLARQGIMVTQ